MVLLQSINCKCIGGREVTFPLAPGLLSETVPPWKWVMSENWGVRTMAAVSLLWFCCFGHIIWFLSKGMQWGTQSSVQQRRRTVSVFPLTLLRNSKGAGDSRRPAEQFQIILMEKKMWSFRCINILPHFLLLNAALKGSILASNKRHFFKNLKLLHNYKFGNQSRWLTLQMLNQAEMQMLVQMVWSTI